jgi:hypothetical protein
MSPAQRRFKQFRAIIPDWTKIEPRSSVLTVITLTPLWLNYSFTDRPLAFAYRLIPVDFGSVIGVDNAVR